MKKFFRIVTKPIRDFFEQLAIAFFSDMDDL